MHDVFAGGRVGNERAGVGEQCRTMLVVELLDLVGAECALGQVWGAVGSSLQVYDTGAGRNCLKKSGRLIQRESRSDGSSAGLKPSAHILCRGALHVAMD